MNLSGLEEKSRNNNRTGFIHLAFSVGSKAGVRELTHAIQSDGYEVKSAARITGDRYYESCVVDPEGNLVEITV